MWLVCLDLEGVLFPEIWIAVAERTSVPDLRLTTRDVADYDELMRHRISVLSRESITISDIQAAIDSLDPLPGAVDFLWALRRRHEVIILSDTFVEFWKAIRPKLGFPTMFCNNLIVDPSGKVVDYRLRQPEGKLRAVESLRGLGYRVCAVGDSFNDLSMIQQADRGVLFRSPDSITQRYPDLPRFHGHTELLAFLESL